MEWPNTREKAINAGHRIARRGHDAIVVTTDRPHIFHCCGASVAHFFEGSPYQIIYYALTRLAWPARGESEEEA
jgi:hypothetical protein